MTVYRDFKKVCVRCDGRGTVSDPVSGENQPCSACEGSGQVAARSSQRAIEQARDQRARRGRSIGRQEDDE